MGAILLSAAIACIVALKSISAQREIARRRATLDMLASRQWDHDYLKARRIFNAHAGDSSVLWLDDQHSDSEQSNAIRAILNEYELIAIGIDEGILDENLYRRWFKTQVLRDFSFYEVFICEARKRSGNGQIFIEFERMKSRWDQF